LPTPDHWPAEFLCDAIEGGASTSYCEKRCSHRRAGLWQCGHTWRRQQAGLSVGPVQGTGNRLVWQRPRYRSIRAASASPHGPQGSFYNGTRESAAFQRRGATRSTLPAGPVADGETHRLGICGWATISALAPRYPYNPEHSFRFSQVTGRIAWEFATRFCFLP